MANGQEQPPEQPLNTNPDTQTLAQLVDEAPTSGGTISRQVPKEKSAAFKIIRTSSIFLLAGGAVYILISGPSIFAKLSYLFTKQNQPDTTVDLSGDEKDVAAAVGDALTGPGLNSAPEIVEAAQDTSSAELGIELADNLLVIPKIDVRVPIIWNSASEEEVILANLKKGVTHYGFTSLPNSDSGNVFISGHSSFYWWDDGQYKTIFALLDQLSPGDQAFIQFENNIYVYEISDSITISPTQTEVTNPTDTPTLSLMTCVPVGTALNRLVVQSNLVKTVPVSDAVQEFGGAEIPDSPPTPASEPTVPSTIFPSVPTNRDAIQLIPGP